MKGRYLPLDVMRAVAGLSVPVLHLLEGFRDDRAARFGGHIYFAVEFFLLLMGYMLAHAYDACREEMPLGAFCARRLRRLHPFVVTGLLLGLAVFAVQLAGGPTFFPWLKNASFGTVALAVVCSLLMLPVPGIAMLSPFNACSWTLYYEYLGNIVYGLVLRRVGIKVLIALVLLAAAFTVGYVFQVPYVGGKHGLSIAGGWSATLPHFHNGLARLCFPLVFGLLLARLKWRIVLPPKVAAVGVGLVFVGLLFTPMTWFAGHDLAHRLFECAVIFALLPALVLIGVGHAPVVAESPVARGVVYLAELSYPLYMSHYPLVYIHAWWVRNYSTAWSMPTVLGLCVLEFVLMLLLSYGVMKFWERVCFK